MLDIIVPVGLLAFILILYAAIVFKKDKTPEIKVPINTINKKVDIKEFSKTLEFLRKAFRESYTAILIIFFIYVIAANHFTVVLWQLGVGSIVGYSILEIVKKISLKENKKFDKRFYLGIIILFSTILYLFTTDKETSSWSTLLNATASGILGEGTVFSLVIIIAYILEKIYLKLFNKKEKLNTNLDNGENNISQPDINKRREVSSRIDPFYDDENEISDEISNEIYEQIHDELDGGVKQKGLWTRAIAESGGDENKSKSLYIKMRFKELKERHINFEKIKNRK